MKSGGRVQRENDRVFERDADRRRGHQTEIWIAVWMEMGLNGRINRDVVHIRFREVVLQALIRLCISFLYGSLMIQISANSRQILSENHPPRSLFFECKWKGSDSSIVSLHSRSLFEANLVLLDRRRRDSALSRCIEWQSDGV